MKLEKSVAVGVAVFLIANLFCLFANASEINADAKVKELRIASASDLQFAMPKLIAKFLEHHPEIRATASFGSSGGLVTQILNGAPFDLFLSADSEFPKKLVDANRVVGQPFVYATGHIVLWVTKQSKLDLKKGLSVLDDAEVKRIALANPVHAPYGKAALEALKAAKVYDKVVMKIVLGENVSQTAQFIESGAANVGIIATSLAHSPALLKEGRFEPIEPSLYSAMIQSGVVLKTKSGIGQAQEFRDFLVTDEAGKILKDFGLAPLVNYRSREK